MTREEMKDKADEIRSKINILEKELDTLLDECPHEFVEADCGVGWCIICHRNDFWFCKESPDNVCHYEDDNYCIHCGISAERDSSGHMVM